MSRKKRTTILIETKIAIVKEKLKTDKSDDDLATEFKIDRSTSRIQKGYFNLVEESLYKWYTAARSANIPLSYEILHERSLQFYDELKMKKAKTSPRNVELDQLLDTLRKHDKSTDMNSEDYSSVDDSCSTFFVPNVQEIVEEVLVEEILVEEILVEANLREYTSKDIGNAAFTNVLGYLEQFSSIGIEDLRKIKDIYQEVEIEELQKLKQPTIFDILRLSKD
ncbi:hypothetical protein BpHYR1_029974 [Brachionus plicatilis]|uniref:Uncharacterized protein n=1 Tax=Brachionus plicatilis TaxID=10195 RepID=A0A3M7Q5C8_BRAPC|nr:hypothetical protein BpHYR1_029974 [Brachionus plicatilis]